MIFHQQWFVVSAPRSLKRVHPANRRSAIDKEARFTLPILSNNDNGITRVRIINRERWYSLNQSSLSIIIPTADAHFRLSVYLILCLSSLSIFPQFHVTFLCFRFSCSFYLGWRLQSNLVTVSKLSVLGNLWPVENYSVFLRQELWLLC